jgi:glycosyltransferase involved in cell wall biosynthesis
MSSAISVVMTVHNGKRFLAAQLQSVVCEMQPQDELIVIDDSSSDGSYDWLANVNDERVLLHRHQRNLGVLRSFENALCMTRHDIIFLCDQDDVWLSGKRAAFVSEFERNPRALIVISDAEMIDAADRVIESSFMATRGGFHGGLWNTLVRNRYLGCAMAIRRELLIAALPIPRSVPMHDMWLGALASALGQVRYIPQPLLRYRRHGGNLSPSRRQSWSRMLRWRLALLAAVAARLGALALGKHATISTTHVSRRE